MDINYPDILKSFLEIPYDELERKNLSALKKGISTNQKLLEQEYKDYLSKESKIKAITLCFTDIEGRFHMIDYDKKYFIHSDDNLTFDGSSIRGFSSLHESDLRLKADYSSFRWLPADIFGAGKVIMFADILNRDRSPYESDFRSLLSSYSRKLQKEYNYQIYLSAEIEGFLVDGKSAEQNFIEENGFKLISTGGYYHSLPLDKLRQFIDRCAEAQRAMGFGNEKDHPEVAASHFELNFKYRDVNQACDNIQLYKLVCRQIANSMDMTATFLPKPKANINGSGMHLNYSLNKKGENLFFDDKGRENLSSLAWEVIERILNHAPEMCLVLNSSVNAYRRLDPKFEAPNQIKVSAVDRGSMIRIPAGNEKTARIEIRSVACDANPYLALFLISKTALEGQKLKKKANQRDRLRFLPDNIYDAIKTFKASDWINKTIGEVNKEKYCRFKQLADERSPKNLGNLVKRSEIIYHHEVTNQILWNEF